MKKKIQQCLPGLETGCSAMTWESLDHHHFLGRNFDFNRIAEGSGLTYIPKQMTYYTLGSQLENNIADQYQVIGKYAALGMGSLVMKSTPVLYEGVNECGLCGSQLYYRNEACWKELGATNKKPVQPAYVVTYLLTQCASVEEVKHCCTKEIAFVKSGVFGKIPDIHWLFTDTSGASLIIEQNKSGLHLYNPSMGILTNSPSYPWHCEHLRMYANLTPKDQATNQLNGCLLEDEYSGTGMHGLPGDWSSPSRFIRLAFLKAYGQKGKDETEAAYRLFRLLQHVAFPLGLIEVEDTSDVNQYDTNLSPYDYTVYTAVLCAETKRYYWNTYHHPNIQSVCLEDFAQETSCKQILWADF